MKIQTVRLRDYQADVINDAYREIRAAGGKPTRGLVAAATGSGKTIIATVMARHAAAKRRVLFVVDRDNLVSQTLATFSRFIPGPIGVIKADYPENRSARVQIASRQTMQSRGWWRSWIREQPAIIFVDEAHEVAFSKVIRDELDTPAPGQIWLLLTATPWRLSKREGMGDICDWMVQAPPPKALMERGQLLWPRYVCVRDFDTSTIGRVGGDYNQGLLSKVSNTPRVIASLYRNWVKWVNGERNVIFAVNKDHAKNIAAHWKENGRAVSVITEESGPDERKAAYVGLKDGSVPTLINVNVATKGFDETKIRWVVLARATKSVSLLHQMIGRGGRTDRPCLYCGDEVPLGEPAICRSCGRQQPEAHVEGWPTWFGVLDQTGTLLDPGMCLPDQIERYELVKGAGGEPGRPPTKVCPRCNQIVPLSASVCPPSRGGCGWAFPVREAIETVGQAVELTATDATRSAYSKLARLSWAAGYDPGYTDHKWKARGRKPPTPDVRLHAIFARPTDSDRAAFRAHLERCAAKKLIERQAEIRKGKRHDPFRAQAWIEQWMAWEFGEGEA